MIILIIEMFSVLVNRGTSGFILLKIPPSSLQSPSVRSILAKSNSKAHLGYKLLVMEVVAKSNLSGGLFSSDSRNGCQFLEPGHLYHLID